MFEMDEIKTTHINNLRNKWNLCKPITASVY